MYFKKVIEIIILLFLKKKFENWNSIDFKIAITNIRNRYKI